MKKSPAFVSYAREDSAFALRLAADLKARGAHVWLDQLDIRPGQQWDREVEQALTNCSEMLAILSPAAIDSNNVMDEVGFALEEQRAVIPILHQDCRVPFRLRRVQYIDFRSGYEKALEAALTALASEDQVAVPANQIPGAPPVSDVPTERDNIARQKAAADKAEQDRIAREKADADRKTEQDRIARQKAAADKAEQDRIAREKADADRKTEQDRIARQRAAADKAEQDRIAREKADAVWQIEQKVRSNEFAPDHGLEVKEERGRTGLF